MTLVLNKRTRYWECDFRSSTRPRLHVSLRTKRKGEAEDRHAAVKALYRSDDVAVLEALRSGTVTVEGVTRVYEAKQPFATLITTTGWPTLGVAIDEYLAWYREQDDIAQSSVDRATQHLEAARAFFGPSTRVDSIQFDHVVAWKRALGSDPDQPRQPWTVGLYLVRLGALYNWITRQEERRAAREIRAARMLHNPVEAELLPEKPQGRTRFLSKTEAQIVLASTPARLQFPVAVALFAGLRIGEVCALRPPPHDIDLDHAGGLIFVQPREGWRPKNGKRREIPIAPELRPFLVRHLERYASARWMLPSPREEARPIRRDGLEKHFKTIVEAAGLTYGHGEAHGVTFHTLRHTFASWLVMDGVDLFTVARLLGHSSTKQVEETYGHLSPDHKRLAVQKLGRGLDLTGVLDAEPIAGEGNASE